MELEDFKIPLLNNFSDVIDFSNIGNTEEIPEVKMEDAVKEIGAMIDERLAQSNTMMDEVLQLRVTNDERYLVYITETDLVIWDRKTRERRNRSLPFTPQYLELIRGDKCALIGRAMETRVLVYQLENLEVFKVLDTHKAKIKSLFLSPNQTTLVSTMQDEEVLK